MLANGGQGWLSKWEVQVIQSQSYQVCKMPVDIQTWRARIGTYNAGRLSAIQIRYGLPKSLQSKKGLDVLSGCGTILVTVLLLLYGVLRGRIGVSDIIQVRCGGRSKAGVSSMKVASISCGAALLLFGLAMALSLLLMQAGDVERNPGPSILTMEDLPVLMTKLKEIAGQWHPLGIRLHFTPGALIDFPPAIQDDPTLALQELLTNWLQRTDPPPTLESLAEAVGGPVIGNELLARTLLEQRADFPSVQTRDIAVAGEKRRLQRDDTEEKIGETPRLADAFRILFPVANDWQTIGSLMHIPPEVLENIRTTEREVPTNCLRAMLGEAFRLTDTPLTWRALAEAVKPINPAKAKEIRDAYYRVEQCEPQMFLGREEGSEKDSQQVIRKLENEVKTLQKDKSSLQTVINELEERIVKLQEEPATQQVTPNTGQFALSPSFHVLPGVQFISKTTFRVHGSEDLQTFQWESCGFKMHIPSGALAKSVQCDVTVATSMSGSFEQPQETTPVSAVYYIETSKEFSKPVMLELEHCCHLDKYSEGALTFAVANTATRRPPYRFQWLQGGYFQPTSSYGCISVSRFSIFEILWNMLWGGRNTPDIEYYGYLCCKKCSRCEWTVVLVITKKLSASLQALQNYYHPSNNWHEVTKFNVHFGDGSDSISLDIPSEGVERDNGHWHIQPNFTPKIMKRDIDEFRPERPASCELTVTRQKEDEHPRDLKYCINLSGLQQPDYVLLKIPASETDIPPALSSATTSENPRPALSSTTTSEIPPVLSSATTSENPRPALSSTTTSEIPRPALSSATAPSRRATPLPLTPEAPQSSLASIGLPGIELDERPSLPELLRFPGERETFSIPERIGTNYSKFGIHLLEDKTGAVIAGIVRGNAEFEEINLAILRRWLQGKGRRPVTWRTLVKVLQDAGLNILAEDIETVKYKA